MEYPIDTDQNKALLAYWLGYLHSLLNAVEIADNLGEDIYNTKILFSENFHSLFPKVEKSLNDIEPREISTGAMSEKVWDIFHTLLNFWMQIESENIPGTEPELDYDQFMRTVKLSKHKVKQLLQF